MCAYVARLRWRTLASFDADFFAPATGP